MRMLAAAFLLAQAAALDVLSLGSALTAAPDSALDLSGQLLTMISAGAGLDLNLAPPSNATVLDTDVDKLAQGLAKLKLDKKATPEMAGFVKTVNGMINDDMMPKIIAGHKKDINAIKIIDTAFSLCTGKRRTSDTKIKNLITKSGKTSTAHKGCRRVQQQMWGVKTSCTAIVKAKYRLMKSECQKERLMRRSPATEANYCHTTKKSEPYGNWLARNYRWFAKKEKGYGAQKLKCDRAAADYKKEKPICDRRVKAWKSKASSCNVKQDSLEGDTCSAGKQSVASCKDFRKCYRAALKAKYREQPIIQKDEKDRKLEWRALKRIECLLGVFAGDEEVNEKVIGECKKKVHSTTNLNIKYTRAPARKRCAATPNVPCSTKYHRQYYWRLPRNSQPKRCKPCALKSGGFGVDPVYWLTAKDFVPKQNLWFNKGTGPNVRSVVISGKANLELDSGHGANSRMVAVMGSTSTRLRFGRIVPRYYTICSLTRYTSSNRKYQGRILNGDGANWLHGHHGGHKYRIYANGWMANPNRRDARKNVKNWVAACSKSSGRAPHNIMMDGKSMGYRHSRGQYPGRGLYINAGRYGNERSMFAISDLMVWDSPLSDYHMKKAMNFLMGKLKAKASKKVVDQRRQIVKQKFKPTYWLLAKNFKLKENKWVNLGSKRGTINGVIKRGNKPTMALTKGYGATAQILSINGDYNTRLNFGPVIPSSLYTICSLTRYTGSHRKRILTSSNNNWLHGHWASRTGVAYYQGWKTTTSNKGSLHSWLAMCSTNYGREGSNVIVNGKNVGRATGGARPTRDMIINAVGGWKARERSDFAVAEIKIWDHSLPRTAMQAEMKKLMKKLSKKTSATARAKLYKIMLSSRPTKKVAKKAAPKR